MSIFSRTSTLDRFRDRALELGEQAMEVAEQVQDEVAEQVTELRRNLADQIDPGRAPRRMPRWLLIGVLVLGLGMIAGAVATWRSRQAEGSTASNGQHPTPEHVAMDGSPTAAGNGVNTEAR